VSSHVSLKNFSPTRKLFSAFIFALLVAGVVIGVQPSQARESTAPKLGEFPLVVLADMPREARETLSLVRKGGPFPYSQDGVVFSNRERALFKQPRGYYHEYTVKTPGTRTRGARRIVCGGNPNA